MTIEEIKQLKDGTRVILTQTGSEWVEEDKGASGVCVKIGNRLVEADIARPDDSNIWYPYYSIDELNDKGYECEVELENIDGSTADKIYQKGIEDALWIAYDKGYITSDDEEYLIEKIKVWNKK